MFKIGYDKKITMVQGDTGVIRMRIHNYELSQGDEVRFAIVNKANPSILLCQHSDKKIVLEKQVTVFEKDGSARIILYPYDTEYLQPGKYLYEIQVKTKDGRIDTVVPLTGFTLMEGCIQGVPGAGIPGVSDPSLPGAGIPGVSDPSLPGAGTNSSEIELRFVRLENEIIPELGNRIANVENEIDSVSSSLDNMEKKSFVSITDFGAKAEINFDNTEAIQNAIDFACDNKIPLYIPAGIYETNGTLNITKPIHFFGSGWSETIIKYLGNGICINIEGQGTPSTKDWVKYSTFRDFSITATENLELSKRFSRVGIKICRCVISEFKNIKISWFAECGVLFEGREDDPVTRGNCCYNNHFNRVENYKCGNGIIVNARISDTYFIEVDASYLDGHAYLFKDMAHETYNVNITRNTLVKVKTGIEIRNVGVFNLLIENNYIEHFSEYGIYYNCPTDFCDYGKIVGNALFYNQEENVGEAIGIKIEGGRMLDISNNCFYNDAKTDIEITNRSTKCYEHGNNVRRRDLIKILAPSTVSYYYKYDYSQNYTQFDRGVGTRMGDVIVEAPWSGFVCKSPNGTAYRLRVDDEGQLVIENA